MSESSKAESQRSSLISRGARVQFAIGIALISVIPLLTTWALISNFGTDSARFDEHTLLTVPLLVVAAIGGYIILRKYPVNIVRLRDYLEQMLRGELPEHVTLLRAEDDLTAVEKCLNLILEQLHERVDLLRKEKQQLQQQLYQMQKMESLGVMAAGVAHDFNNLLTGILGNVNLLSDHLAKDPQSLRNIDEIEMLIQQASDLTHQMMTYAGKGRMKTEPVDVSALIHDTQSLLKASVHKGLELKYELADGLPKVDADATQLKQVFMNLVINASDSIGNLYGSVTMTTGQMRSDSLDLKDASVNGKVPYGSCVCVAVTDTGCGMDSDTRARIFDPFFTTKTKGRGLGLAVVLGIVVAHKGAIVVNSEPGKGTRFRVLLPAV